MPWLALVTFQDVEGIKSLAELGIVFLMFMIGLELSPARLWALRRDVFGTGVAQVGLTACLIGLFAFVFGNPPAAAMAIGLTLAMSSTAVAKAAFTITLLYVVGRRVAKPLLSSAAVQRQPDVFVALILLLALGIAALTAASGLSLALGALLAGLLLADTEFQYEVEIIVEPFKGLLMGLFFMAVGMEVDPRLAAEFPLLLPASVLGLLVVKASVVALLLARLGWGPALQAGLLLGHGGEFAFIILAYAVGTRLLTPEASQSASRWARSA